MKKIVFLTLDPQSSISLGLVTKELLTRLDPAKYQKFVFSPSSPPLQPRDLGYCHVYHFPSWKGAVPHLLDLIKPDIVIPYGPIELIESYGTMVPEHYEKNYHLIYYWTFEMTPAPPRIKPFLHRAKEIWVVSEWQKREAEKSFSSPSFKVLPHGVDLKTFSFHPTPFENKPFTYGYVGRLYGRKQVNRFIKAFHFMKNAVTWNPFFLLASIPEGDEVRLVGEQAYNLGLKREQDWDWVEPMLLNIPVSNEYVAACYHAFNVLAYPTGGEAWGLPLTEAMATGTPIITTDLEVTREVTRGAAIFIPPVDIHPSYLGDLPLIDIPKFKNAMIEIHDDKALYNDLITLGHMRAQELTWEASVKRMVELLEEF